MFELHGLSTNIKMKPGDYVYLIPDDMRGRPGAHLDRGWRVRVDTMIWRSTDDSYQVESQSVWPKHKLLTGDATLEAGQPWYVFGTRQMLGPTSSSSCCNVHHSVPPGWVIGYLLC